MYHTLISRKPKTSKPVDDFTPEVERLTYIVNQMTQPNASMEYSKYFIYKELFDSFTAQLVYLDHASSDTLAIDTSYNYSEEYKHIFVREKQKPILELLKNRNNV